MDALQAGIVVASKMAITADNLNPDPNFRDPAYWHSQRVSDWNGSAWTGPGEDHGGFHTDAAGGWSVENSASRPDGVALATLLGCSTWITLNSAATGMPTDRRYRYHLYSGWSVTREFLIPVKADTVYEFSIPMKNNANQWHGVIMDVLSADFTFLNDADAVTSGERSWFCFPGQVGRFKKQVTFGPKAAFIRFAVINDGVTSIWAGDAQVGTISLREAVGGTLVVDGAIVSRHITVDNVLADRIIANTATVTGTFAAKVIESTDSLPGRLIVSGTGFSLATMATAVADPAGRINANTTLIAPGKIQLGGANTLSNWLTGGDNSELNGGVIAANTIRINSAVIGLRGIQLLGINFDTDRVNTVSWSAGYVDWVDDAGNRQVSFINAGSVYRTTAGSQVAYIWFDRVASHANQIFYAGETTPAAILANTNNIIVAAYFGGNVLDAAYGRTIIDGDYLKTSTVDANRVIVSGSITTPLLAAGSVTAAKISVASLSAITADVGLLRTASSGARTEIEANQIRVYDASNVQRVTIGQL
ncbi:hypothetical protein [Sphingomonas sp.]|uniref:hypothetical protein n=1 Tax=Sphingomonas sp. TaxID=28214 RepID=UPI000DB87BC9|nr:hypothetical protein [Sphingomonas sp.]PZU10274.1 MAG: hypothetical protein DI605_06755 [Sphingomonas sp.]